MVHIIRIAIHLLYTTTLILIQNIFVLACSTKLQVRTFIQDPGFHKNKILAVLCTSWLLTYADREEIEAAAATAIFLCLAPDDLTPVKLQAAIALLAS